MPRKAYSYIRFSSPEQAKGDSLRRQLEATTAYCRHNDLVLDDSLSMRDMGVSGFRGRHRTKGALAAFLEAVQARRIEPKSVLIVESLDRLSREEIDTARETIRQILLAGIEIVTLSPERRYDRRSLNDAFALLEIIVIAQRAHEESAMKSLRLGKAWEGKRQRIAEKKLTGQCPAWLRLSADGKTFEEIDDAVAVVRRIFKWCIDGHGIFSIMRRLNNEGVPPIARAVCWHKSYVTKILKNRAVIGEYQPHKGHAGSDRKPIGDPIQNYYPAIISEADFYRAQQALKNRKQQAGPAGDTIANLFTGLVRDGRDGATMTLVDKGTKKLVSSAAQRGGSGSIYQSFSYDLFENAVLQHLQEITLAEILPPNAATDDLDDQLKAIEGKLATVEGKIVTTHQRIKDDAEIASLLDVIVALDKEKADLKSRHEALSLEKHSRQPSALSEAKSLIQAMQEVAGDDLTSLRRRIKSKLRHLIDKIVVVVFDETVDDFSRKGRSKTFRFADMQINYKGGQMRRLVAEEKTGFMFAAEKGGATHVNLTYYENWFESGNHQLARVLKACYLAMLMEHLRRKDLFIRYFAEFCRLARPSGAD